MCAVAMAEDNLHSIWTLHKGQKQEWKQKFSQSSVYSGDASMTINGGSDLSVCVQALSSSWNLTLK